MRRRDVKGSIETLKRLEQTLPPVKVSYRGYVWSGLVRVNLRRKVCIVVVKMSFGGPMLFEFSAGAIRTAIDTGKVLCGG
jgi:hypothetical protein